MPQVVALVGAECEENPSLWYLAVAVQLAGFRAEIVPFNDDAWRSEIAERVLALDPFSARLAEPGVNASEPGATRAGRAVPGLRSPPDRDRIKEVSP